MNLEGKGNEGQISLMLNINNRQLIVRHIDFMTLKRPMQKRAASDSNRPLLYINSGSNQILQY